MSTLVIKSKTSHFTDSVIPAHSSYNITSISSESCLQAAGSTLDGNTNTIIVGIVNFASTFLATVLIDRFGRKVLLYISSVAMILSLTVLGTFFYLKDQTDTDVVPYGWLPLASFVIYVIGFSFGFGPIPWLMMGEILPGKFVETSLEWLYFKSTKHIFKAMVTHFQC